FIERRQAAVEWQDHEREVGINEPELDRESVVEERQRRRDQPDGNQQLVQQTIGLEDRDPGIDADQKAGPERQHDQKQQKQSPSAGRAGDRIGDRVTEDQAQRRRQCGIAERAQIGAHIEIVAGEQGKVRQSRLDSEAAAVVKEKRRIGWDPDGAAREADLQNDQQREQKK